MPGDFSDDRLKVALEAWKVAIGVQQHFNTIEMQIRSIAVTVLTASIGAAALTYGQAQDTVREAIKAGIPAPNTSSICILGLHLSPADMIVLGGLIAWLAFYLMDRWWYHRLLQGAVTHAQSIEDEMKADERVGSLLALSNAIRMASPFFFLGKVKVRSDTKVDLFYGAVLIVLILIMLFAF